MQKRRLCIKVNKLIEKLKSIKGMGIVVIFLALGLFLVFFSGNKSGGGDKSELYRESFDFYEYEERLEKRLEEKINALDGISSCEVILLVDTSYIYDYLRDENGKIIIGDISGDDIPISESETAPKIRGVAVICKGAKSAQKKKEIVDMLSALLKISTNNIWVGSKE